MKATSKTLSYIKRMITMKKWTDTLPPASKIAESLSVSYATVRKAITILEHQRVVENNSSLGYGIIPKKFEELYTKNKTLYYLAMLNRNIRIASMLDQGGQIFGNFVFLGTNQAMTIASIASGIVVKTNIHELRAMSIKPVTVDSMLQLDGDKLKKAKRRYNRQQKLGDVRELVFRHRKELGL